MEGCVGNASTLVRLDIRFTGGSRSLRGYQPKDGCGTWSRTTIRELMRLSGFSTFPRFEMVDRHGFAPCSPACKAGDLLNDRAAQLKVARRLGAAPSLRSFGDSAALAGARRVVKKMERPAGIASASPEWRSGILLLNDDRNRKRRRSYIR